MKKIVLVVMLCCSFCAVSNAIWLPAFFLRFVSAWGETRECDRAMRACSETGDPHICRSAAEICARERGL
jgi:hypothetical protein